MDLILNDVLVSDSILESMKNLDADVAEACDKKAMEISKEIFPTIDFTMQENVDLVVRPMSAVIAINEMLLQNMYSATTLDGILNSATIPDTLKAKMLKNFAALNNINSVSNDPESIYSEIVYGAYSNDINNKKVFESSLYGDFPDLTRIFFVDDSSPEMMRNKISYIQIDNKAIMDFERSEFNRGTLIDGAYSRSDYQKYQEYKNSDRVSMPGMLDVYFSTPVEIFDYTVQKGTDGFYTIPSGYHIDVYSDKEFVILEEDKMRYGIVKEEVRIDIDDGNEEETFRVMSNKDPMFENYSKEDSMTVRDVMYKGFFPLLIHFDLYTKYDIDVQSAKDVISEYLESISGSMPMMSLNSINTLLKESGIMAIVSSVNNATFIPSVGVKIPMTVTFPITMRDVDIPVELKNEQMSDRTIRLYVGDVNVFKE